MKTWSEINQRIEKNTAVVLTAQEVKEMAAQADPSEIAAQVDIVTTATFGPMCSSGVFLNFGHTQPPLKMEEIYLNKVAAYGGIAAVDTYLGATQKAIDCDDYGGAHVIEELLKGEEILLEATGKGTDCYPRQKVKTAINLNQINEAWLFNPRNAYQNYVAAINSSASNQYTYMGTLLKNSANITYSTSGELSPLLNSPNLTTIGLGSRIFLGGATGYIATMGTQYNSQGEKSTQGITKTPGATLAVMGDLKKMSPEFIKAASYYRYGISLFVGIGVAIPILNAQIAKEVSIRNQDLVTKLVDFGNNKKVIGEIDYYSLQSGSINLKGRKIKTSPLSSILKAQEITEILKFKIKQGQFFLTKPLEFFPPKGVNQLKIRDINLKKPSKKPLKQHKYPQFIEEDCIHCGACTASCPTTALTLTHPQYLKIFKQDKCITCQGCLKACPRQIISFGAE